MFLSALNEHFLRLAKNVLASTNSGIGVQLSSGRIQYIYCNSDSYNNFAILRKYYTDISAVRDLISGGDIRGLEENPEDLERYSGTKPKVVSGVDAFRNVMSTDYLFLFVKGKWLEVTEGVSTRNNTPNMKYVHTIEAAEALREALDVGMARTVLEKTMTMREGTSNKYHYFAIYDLDGTFVGGNAYARIGEKPKTIEIARGQRMTVFSQVQKKMRVKQQRGYNAQN